MSLNLLYVKYFCDAVKFGGVSAAAKVNFVTQSAVSQGISKLEQSLDSLLITHHSNRFRLTPDGERAFTQLSDILKKADTFKENFSRDEQNFVGNLEFACLHSFALTFIPQFLKEFRKSYPEAKISFYCLSNVDEIKKMLRAGLIDFGITLKAGHIPGFEEKPIYKGNYGLYVGSNVEPYQEKELGFILPDPADTSLLKESYHQKYAKLPEVFLEVGSWEVIANLAMEELGIGYFPDYITLRKEGFLRQCETDLKLPSYEISSLCMEGTTLRKSSEIFLSYFESAERSGFELA